MAGINFNFIAKLNAMKNIIIPVDFSPYSISAARTGAFLAKHTGAQIHLLHVADIPADWKKQPLSVRKKNSMLEGRLREVNAKLLKLSKNAIFKGIRVSTDVTGEIPYEQITAYAKTLPKSLIVMGAHGAGDAGGLFIGSTTQRVLRTAPCPVLSVKKNYRPKAIRKIVFASDFENKIAAQLNIVKDLAEDLKASVDLLFVNTPTLFKDSEQLDKRMLREIPAKTDVAFKCVVYQDHHRELGIYHYAKKSKAGMIAMITNLRIKKHEYSLGVTETLLFHTDVPLLSFAVH